MFYCYIDYCCKIYNLNTAHTALIILEFCECKHTFHVQRHSISNNNKKISIFSIDSERIMSICCQNHRFISFFVWIDGVFSLCIWCRSIEIWNSIKSPHFKVIYRNILQATLFIIYRFTLFDHHYHQQMSIFVVASNIENSMEHWNFDNNQPSDKEMS